jgi:hypothetical protein
MPSLLYIIMTTKQPRRQRVTSGNRTMATAFVQTLKDMKTDEVRYEVVVNGLFKDKAQELARRIQATLDMDYNS